LSLSFGLAACQGSEVVGKVKKRGQKGATGRKKEKTRRRTAGRSRRKRTEGKTSVVDEATRWIFAIPFLQAQIYGTLKKCVVDDKVTQTCY